MQPNSECTDAKCCELQRFYQQNPAQCKRQTLNKAEKEEDKPKHEENEWGISLENEPSDIEKQIDTNVTESKVGIQTSVES